MGGYAGRHHEAVAEMEAAGECRLIATCDPEPEEFAAQAEAWRLSARGVTVDRDYRRMLGRHAGELDVVVVPTPIPLHAEMHRAAVAAGAAVYLEKPPTLDPAELEEMIATDAAAKAPTLVGFNFIAEPARRALKARLLAGEFGALQSARLLGRWGRADTYYGRNGWAGRLVGDDGRLVLDSCLGNGLSHHVHNLLHWAGARGLDDWASLAGVRASLRRAHPIEGADTMLVAADTACGVPLRLALTHACSGPEIHRETVVCERAEIVYVTRQRAEVRWRDGRVETLAAGDFDAQALNLRELFACLRGERARPPTTLADCRPFVALHALTYVSAQRILNFSEAAVERVAAGADAPRYLSVRGLDAEMAGFLATGEWPWGSPREARPAELGRLDEVVRRMAAERAAACS